MYLLLDYCIENERGSVGTQLCLVLINISSKSSKIAVGPFTKPTKTIPKLPNLYKICIMCIWVWYLVIGLVKEHPFTKPYTKQKGPFTKPNLKFTWVIPID